MYILFSNANTMNNYHRLAFLLLCSHLYMYMCIYIYICIYIYRINNHHHHNDNNTKTNRINTGKIMSVM